MVNIILFLLLLNVIVFFHEFGHYLFARIGGIHVNEFALGMGPKLLSVSKNGTRYSLRALPVGGFCAFKGEDTSDEDCEDTEGSFLTAPLRARIPTVLAGPVFNFILGFFLVLITVPGSYIDRPVVQEVTEGYPVGEAGIRPGDLITSINGQRIYLAREILLFGQFNGSEDVRIGYERDGKRYEVSVKPKLEPESGRYLMGFYGYSSYEECPTSKILEYSFYETRFLVKSTLTGYTQLFKGNVSRKDVSGPVGMVKVVGEVADSVKPMGVGVLIKAMINLAAVLTVNLGFINLLPLPALDGGRLLFMLVELVRGKPVPADKEGYVHMIGFALLICLMVFLFFNDITNILGI